MKLAWPTSPGAHITPIDAEAYKVRAAKAGDVLSFEDLVRNNKAKVLHLAFSITGNREDAEDAMQTTFVKAHQRIGQFRGDSLFSMWLRRIAINEALMQVRRRRARHLSLDDSPQTIERLITRDIQPWERTPEQHSAETELRRVIYKALSGLERSYRFIFVLRCMEELSTAETARLLGFSVSR